VEAAALQAWLPGRRLQDGEQLVAERRAVLLLEVRVIWYPLLLFFFMWGVLLYKRGFLGVGSKTASSSLLNAAPCCYSRCAFFISSLSSSLFVLFILAVHIYAVT
jgi:hypothetical protein